MNENVKRANGKQRAWIKLYEDETGFDCMRKEELESGAITFNEFARINIVWYEDHSKDTYLRISQPPYTDAQNSRAIHPASSTAAKGDGND